MGDISQSIRAVLCQEKQWHKETIKTGGLFLFCCYLFSFFKKKPSPHHIAPQPQKTLTPQPPPKSLSTPILPTQLPPPLPLTYAELYDMSVLFTPELAI